MAYVSGPSGDSCIEMFRFRTSFAPHSYVNGLFLTRQSEPNTCVIYQQTYYVGIKEVHSEPTSAECDRLFTPVSVSLIYLLKYRVVYNLQTKMKRRELNKIELTLSVNSC